MVQIPKKFISRKTNEAISTPNSHLDQIRTMIQEAITQGEFPGANIVIIQKGTIILREAFGNCQVLPERRPMRIDLIFDLASLTKPIATATSIMQLIEQGEISLEDSVGKYLPEFQCTRSEIRIWHLLTHTSGLPADIQSLPFGAFSVDKLMGYIAQLGTVHLPGTLFQYSCLGFIVLAKIIEQVTGKSIAEYSHKHIFGPLGMRHTFFCPSGPYLSSCVPTAMVNGAILKGIVHDPLSRLQGGISGNAGLFSTIDDVSIFASMMLKKGQYGNRHILQPETVNQMTSIYFRAQFAGRGLGWDVSSKYAVGTAFGQHSYGHTGYTGTMLWIDPDNETILIFLSNRIHPTDKGPQFLFRKCLTDAVAKEI